MTDMKPAPVGKVVDLVELERETRRRAQDMDWAGLWREAAKLYADAARMRDRIQDGERFEPLF